MCGGQTSARRCCIALSFPTSSRSRRCNPGSHKRSHRGNAVHGTAAKAKSAALEVTRLGGTPDETRLRGAEKARVGFCTLAKHGGTAVGDRMPAESVCAALLCRSSSIGCLLHYGARKQSIAAADARTRRVGRIADTALCHSLFLSLALSLSARVIRYCQLHGRMALALAPAATCSSSSCYWPSYTGLGCT